MKVSRAVVVACVVLALMTLVLVACGGGSSKQTSITAPGPWDLVALGGSMATGYGVEPKEAYTRVYAALLAEEQGVRVRVLDHSSNDPRPLAVWIEVLANDASLRSDLAKAEIVTIFDGTHNLGVAFEECGFHSPEAKACFEAATAPIPADADRLLAALRKLVPEQAIILWGYDGGAVPPAWWDSWSQEPYWPEMKRILFDNWRPGLRAAADAHGATVIGFKAAFSRPDGEPTPEVRGFMQADGLHFTAEGHRFLAELHLAQDGLGDQ
jgi:lysophospholipase L1-like esterase